MPPVHLLIKPVSAHCNMRCAYCFYSDIACRRAQPDYGIMTLDALEIIVRKTLDTAEGDCTFAFQGGEPTLAGLDFYKALIDFVRRHNRKRLRVQYAIQTNGLTIDDAWAAFLAENDFLTGLSLDGTKEIHDAFRMDANGDGTFKTVIRAAAALDRHNAQYNLLTVVTALTAKNIGKIYGFFKRNRFLYQQYIPCIEPYATETAPYSLTPSLYGRFLTALFDLWYNDRKRGIFVYNRNFENLAGMMKGYPPEHCGMRGVCGRQTVIEADGTVFPCDFYASEPYKIGNILTDSFAQIEDYRKHTGFIEASLSVMEKCRSCRWLSLCRGGCRRDRDIDGMIGLNKYCEAYATFFTYAADRLATL